MVYVDWIMFVSAAGKSVGVIRGVRLGKTRSTERAQNEDGTLKPISILWVAERYSIFRSEKRRNSGGSESSVLRSPLGCDLHLIIEPFSYF